MTQQAPFAHFEIIDRSLLVDYPHDLMVSYCVDCACAVSAASLLVHRPFLDHDAQLCIVPELHFETLPGEFWAVFNPTGAMGIIVLDEASLSLLQTFASPISTETVLQDYVGNKQAVSHAIQRLAQLDLLRPVGAFSPHFSDSDHHLLTAWLHITNSCNLNCTYCYVNKNQEHMGEETGKAAIDAVIRTAIAEGYPAIRLKYAGGEASLRLETVFVLHDYAVARCRETGVGLQAVFLTNGVTLDMEGIAGLKARKIEVMVSLDSVDSEGEGQRPFLGKQNSTSHVLKGIERLLAQGISPHITITVTDNNSAGIEKVVRFALKHNLKFSLNFYRDNEVAVKHANVQFTSDRIIAGMQAAFQAIEENMPAWSVVGAILDRGQLVEPHHQACGAAKDYLAIDHQGRVAKCHMELGHPVGDISQENLLPAIQSSSIGLQNIPSTEKEGCRECKWRFYCAGGCPLATYRATGRYDIKSPNCNIYKAIFPLAVRLEGKRLLRYKA